MRTRNSRLARNMRPRGKTCVPIRVILRFRELCIHIDCSDVKKFYRRGQQKTSDDQNNKKQLHLSWDDVPLDLKKVAILEILY